MTDKMMIQRLDMVLRIRRDVLKHDIPEHAHDIINKDILEFVQHDRQIKRIIRLNEKKAVQYHLNLALPVVKIVNITAIKEAFL